MNRLILTFALILSSAVAHADRIKDMASVAGVRSNQLIGYGLVVGLNGTGDGINKTKFTEQSLRAMLSHYGVQIPPNVSPSSKNIAAVVVHADLPAFAKPGQNIDVTVSSLGDAKSLRGGSLLMTPLKGVDGEIYALAQGNLIVGGFGAETQDGSSITVNIPSAGRIPGGAMVEREVATPFQDTQNIFLNLHQADFTSAKRVTDAINDLLGAGTANALDAVTVAVGAPLDPSQRVDFVSFLENIEVNPAQPVAKVIVNSRTGTVVIGSNVQVSPAAVSHGNLTVAIRANNAVSQPNALADGETTPVSNADISIDQEKNRMFILGNEGAALNDIVTAVNRVGAAPGDLVAILEALKQAGALRAELVVI